MLNNDERYILLDRIDRLEKALKNTIEYYECELNDLNHELALLLYYDDIVKQTNQPIKLKLKEVSANDLLFYSD